MSHREEALKTAYGEVTARLVICDGCSDTRISKTHFAYRILDWYHIERVVMGTSVSGNPVERQELLDFCSIDCLVRHLVPDIYSADPAAVARAIENLQKIEKDIVDQPT